ncbi:MAG: nucleotidyltransferase family protein [Kordiimonadaceae bacterium]|nr:nucleotidyltransferase family protein [Kordiimonadaceae bacterium]
MSAAAVEEIIRADPIALEQLHQVRSAGPAAAFIAAGFVRNRVWDRLYQPAPEAPENDVDVVYFCSDSSMPDQDFAYEAALKKLAPGVEWQVRNQARMHSFGGYPPFSSIKEALMHWPETATSVGVRLLVDGSMEFIAPFGFDDLMSHNLRITPAMKVHDAVVFEKRLAVKGWEKRWPNLKVIRE